MNGTPDPALVLATRGRDCGHAARTPTKSTITSSDAPLYATASSGVVTSRSKAERAVLSPSVANCADHGSDVRPGVPRTLALPGGQRSDKTRQVGPTALF